MAKQDPRGLVDELVQRLAVVRHSVILEVSSQLGLEHGPALLQRLPIADPLCPVTDSFALRAQALPARFELRDHRPPASPAPLKREAEQVEHAGWVSPPLALLGTRHQPRFLLVELELILGQALTERFLDATRILRLVTGEDRVIRIPV